MSDSRLCSRRGFLSSSLGLAAAGVAAAQTPVQRDYATNAPVMYYDPDIVILDHKLFEATVVHSQIKRFYTGTLWAEGPAWNGEGHYLVWSDIPNHAQMRWLEEDGHVGVYRNDSGYSNGNTFDYEGRQLSCEHGLRRVVRYEHSGAVTVIADRFEGKRFNAPNDIVVHPDGDIWFTDPIYGISGYYEGFKATPELKPAVYRVDGKSGKIEKMTDDLDQPNGICFSHDYKRVFVADTGTPSDMRVWDLQGKALKGGKQFCVPKTPDGTRTYIDGMRADIDGNIWCGAAPGVQVFSPAGNEIGLIRLPEICANVCFGGTKRNRLFMAASQSLYSVYVDTMGAHIC